MINTEACSPTLNKSLLLKRHHYFSVLSLDIVSELTPYTYLQNFKKGDFIFRQGDYANVFYLVISGSVRVFQLSKEGQELTLHHFKSNETFAEIVVFNTCAQYPANAISLEDTVLLAINATSFRVTLLNYPSVYLELLKTFSERQVAFKNTIEDLAFRSVTSRLAKRLLTLNQTADMDGYIYVKKRDLATHVATISETLSRALKSLSDEGVIEVTPKAIKILNPEKLVKLSE